MEYTNTEDRDRRVTRTDMDDMRRPDRMPDRTVERPGMLHEDGKGMKMPGRYHKGSIRVTEEEKSEKASEIYEELNERICQALSFHSQLADFFCFLGLQGFKRMAEYQYMKECAGKRKVHKRYIDMHHRILPVEDFSSPVLIPREWTKYTTHDIDDSVIPKYVKMGLKQYYEWEKETKELYEDLCEKLMSWNMHADYEFLKELIADVEKECKKAMRLYESLNGTGYDVNAIHQVQDKYHEKYKKKYNDRFTTKNNYPWGEWEPEEGRRGHKRYQIGY